MRRIVTCIGPNQKNQPNLDLYLVQRYIFTQLLLMASVSKYLKDTEDTPFMYLYLVRRYKIFLSVATLETGIQSQVYCCTIKNLNRIGKTVTVSTIIRVFSKYAINSKMLTVTLAEMF